jgi:glycerate dehydrogenase
VSLGDRPERRVVKGQSSVQHAIVFLDRESVDAKVRRPSFPHSYKEYQSTWTHDEIVERLKDADIAIINKVPMRAETLKALPKLKLIAVAATGTDIIDKAYCKANGITIVNIRNYAFNTVPEHVIALIFALRRNLFAYVQDTMNGVWAKSSQFCFLTHPIRDIAGSTLGIVGYGALGKSIAKRAEALGMKVLPFDVVPQPGLVDFETILKESDIITLHVPLTRETKNMIGAKEFKKMKRSAILINTARGGLVDEAALAEALRNGTIAGAGFDVLTKEPPKEGNVLLDPTIPNLIVTPHVAWASQEAMQILADQLIDNIEAFVAGKPQNVVE